MARVYLDHNATSPMRPEAAEAVRHVSTTCWGNPSSVHADGRRARGVIDEARATLARLIGAASPSEIVFVASATEANHLALAGVTSMAGDPWRLITSAVEHPSVLGAATRLAESGRVELDILEVDRHGRVDPAHLVERLDTLRPGVRGLVSIIHGNNETGVLQPIAALTRAAHSAGALVHVDGTQSMGRVPVELGGDDGADLLTLSSHKLGGPRGAGALYVRRGAPLRAALDGGHQERGRRAGTEATGAIAGFVAAVDCALSDLRVEAPRIRALTEALCDGVIGAVPGAHVVAEAAPRLPNTLAIAFPECRGDELLAALDLAGISVSSGSACASGSLEPSHVLLAMGLNERVARSVVRFSLGWSTQAHDIELVLKQLPAIVARCREFNADGLGG